MKAIVLARVRVVVIPVSLVGTAGILILKSVGDVYVGVAYVETPKFVTAAERTLLEVV